MNILVIGNGFDLSHFLPTKYDHFMSAMQSIQKCGIHSTYMSFYDIFDEYLKENDTFLNKTIQFYDISKVVINQKEIENFKKNLEKNVWYSYFLDHITEIKTWIDFEQKIEEALILIANTISKIEDKFNRLGTFNHDIYNNHHITEKDKFYYFSELKYHNLSRLGLIKEDNIQTSDVARYGRLSSDFHVVENTDKYGFNSKKYIKFLQNQLDEFIDIFNDYLFLIIDKIEPIQRFKINNLPFINKTFSFNYTKTYEKFYRSLKEISYLHGKSGESHNLVLGISEIKENSLISLKAYGFTKYHQKIFKNTDYKFLSQDLRLIKEKINLLNELNMDSRAGIARSTLTSNSYYDEIKKIKSFLENIDLNIFIWGHSLDASDEVYINEIFSFNEPFNNNIKVTIFHYDQDSKFDLLTNLFHVLGKDKVELWMKNEWLKFETNPTIEFLN